MRHFFVLEAQLIAAEEKTKDAVAAAQFIDCWDWQGPGVYVGTDFDPFVSSPTRAALLLRIFEGARRKISDFGSDIPLAYLQKHLNSRTRYFTLPQSTERICGEIDRMIALLKRGQNQTSTANDLHTD